MKVLDILAAALACSLLPVSAERPADISAQNAEIILLEDATAYSFRTNGTLTVSEPGSIDVLVVGGGGCGGTNCGGGGGGGNSGNMAYAGGNGGSGVVIVRYLRVTYGMRILLR